MSLYVLQYVARDVSADCEPQLKTGPHAISHQIANPSYHYRKLLSKSAQMRAWVYVEQSVHANSPMNQQQDDRQLCRRRAVCQLDSSRDPYCSDGLQMIEVRMATGWFAGFSSTKRVVHRNRLCNDWIKNHVPRHHYTPLYNMNSPYDDITCHRNELVLRYADDSGVRLDELSLDPVVLGVRAPAPVLISCRRLPLAGYELVGELLRLLAVTDARLTRTQTHHNTDKAKTTLNRNTLTLTGGHSSRTAVRTRVFVEARHSTGRAGRDRERRYVACKAQANHYHITHTNKHEDTNHSPHT